jgi:uncharacterized membrane protein
MTQKKTIITLSVLLFASLALNVFAAGVVLGRHHAPSPHWAQKDLALQNRLPAADRAVLKAAMEVHRDEFKALRAAIDAARAAAQQAAQSGDDAAVDAALEQERVGKEKFFALMRQARQDAETKLSPEGKRTLDAMRPRRPPPEIEDWLLDFPGMDDLDAE